MNLDMLNDVTFGFVFTLSLHLERSISEHVSVLEDRGDELRIPTVRELLQDVTEPWPLVRSMGT